jgi:putative Mn2+ efflux pump MntP
MSMASIIILAVVFVLDALAFVLAIGAEKRRSTVSYS